MSLSISAKRAERMNEILCARSVLVTKRTTFKTRRQACAVTHTYKCTHHTHTHTTHTHSTRTAVDGMCDMISAAYSGHERRSESNERTRIGGSPSRGGKTCAVCGWRQGW